MTEAKIRSESAGIIVGEVEDRSVKASPGERRGRREGQPEDRILARDEDGDPRCAGPGRGRRTP